MIYTMDFESIGMHDLLQVGGKNASLGEMVNQLAHLNIAVPTGFATTADAFNDFFKQNGLSQRVYALLESINIDDIAALAMIGQQIRAEILQTPFSNEFHAAITRAYASLSKRIGHDDFTVAVRSSATAEDLPDASFAGQQETYLNIHGIDNLFIAIKKVFASLFNDRAITYRVHQNFAHNNIAISVGIQQMVRTDLAASGVMFTLDTESGFNDVVFITSAYGLGELVVQGAVNPDEFYVHKTTLRAGKPAVIRKTVGSKLTKMIYNDNVYDVERVRVIDVPVELSRVFSLTQQEVETLALQALTIEAHYKRPMDIEWGKDGRDGRLYILQARPETVKSSANTQILERYILTEHSSVLVEGRSIGQRIGQGKAKLIKDISEMHRVQVGDILVTDMTDPDWEPIMKKAAAIVTNRGGRTCHAAIIARELGIPAIVGCGDATDHIAEEQYITVNCAEGDTGYVHDGLLSFVCNKLDVASMPDLPLKIMLNVGNPERAFAFQSLPNSGVGLARLEFLISNMIGIHPKALLEFDQLQDSSLKQAIAIRCAAYASPVEYYIERLKEGVASIAAAFYPKPVIVRLSDFKSNEYSHLLGGAQFEPTEENPMIGFRGASRYISVEFRDCFALECQAIRRVRETMGLINVEIMIPFVRTIYEAEQVIAILKTNGLERGKDGLRIIMMCEVPSNALLAEQFLVYFDGFSIGSNDLTQLTLGIDRDSGLVASQFDERNEAVKILLHQAIAACKKHGKYIGICGQGPSDHHDFAQWLMQEGIDSVSLNPDSVLDTCLFLAKETI